MAVSARTLTTDLHRAKRLVKKYKISEQNLKEKCHSDVRLAVASELTKWRNVAPYLLQERCHVAVDAIDCEPNLDEEGKRKKLLERWGEICGSEATHEKLIGALVSAGKTDLAEIVCQAIGEP